MDSHAMLEALTARRRALAYEVGQGKTTSEAELEKVEAEIATLERAGERAVLAEQEQQARAEAEAQGRAQAERQEQEERLRVLTRERLAAARRVEAATERLKTALEALLTIGAEMYTLSAALRGRPNDRLRLRGAVEYYLAWQLGLGDRPPHAFRKPLTELLPGVSSPGDGQP